MQPGVEQGETDMLVKVQDEIKHEYSVKVDNFGSATTGDNRLTFTYNQNNVVGYADVLSVNLLQTFTPANTFFGGVDYKTPVGFSGYDVGVIGGGFSHNSFDVGGELAQFGIAGTVVSWQGFMSKQFERSRRSNYSVKADLTNKVAETLIGSTQLSEDTITAVGVEFTFDNLDVVNQGINQGSFKLFQGLPDVFGSLDENSTSASRTSGESNIAISDFTKFTWTAARLQLINQFQNILFKTAGQYTDDILPPVEQYGMGGPNNVRAYTTSEYLRDNAFYVAVDWNFNAPGFYSTQAFDGWKWGEILQLSVFADFANGSINEPQRTDIETLNIAGVGVAAQLLMPGKFTLRFDVSAPILKDDEINDPTDTTNYRKDDVQFYLTFTYTG